MAWPNLEETGLGLSDFAVLEALLHKGPLPVNVIGPKVNLTPGSISVAVERLVAKGLVSRAESSRGPPGSHRGFDPPRKIRHYANFPRACGDDGESVFRSFAATKYNNSNSN